MRCIATVSMLALFCTLRCSNRHFEQYPQELLVDVATIPDSLLPIHLLDVQPKEPASQVRLPQPGVELAERLRALYTLRDPAFIPTCYEIVEKPEIHLYFKLQALLVLGEICDSTQFDRLLGFWATDADALLREYLACALGKVAGRRDVKALGRILRDESNGYVRKTLEASIRRAKGGRRAYYDYLPLYDTSGLCALKTFPAEHPDQAFTIVSRTVMPASTTNTPPLAESCVFPHMQYKMSPAIYDRVRQPFESFGIRTVDHVGEDSGWLFAGMPVHAVMAGRVTLVQHEESWGCLVCVESRLPDGEVVCAYYGHLSHQLDVHVGMLLRKGDKIGEIGPAFTLQNGGYRSHLHTGIEKAPYARAHVAGYHSQIERWHNPLEFIRARL